MGKSSEYVCTMLIRNSNEIGELQKFCSELEITHSSAKHIYNCLYYTSTIELMCNTNSWCKY